MPWTWCFESKDLALGVDRIIKWDLNHWLGPQIQSPVISSSNENCSLTFHPFSSVNSSYLLLDLESFKTAEPRSTPSYFWSSQNAFILDDLKRYAVTDNRYWNRYFAVRVRDRWWWKVSSYLPLQNRRGHNCLLWLLLWRNGARSALALWSPKVLYCASVASGSSETSYSQCRWMCFMFCPMTFNESSNLLLQ